MRTLKLIALAGCGLFAVGLSAQVIHAEAPSGYAAPSRFLALASVTDPASAPGWSLRSQMNFMLECDAAMRGYLSLEMRYAGVEARDRIVDICADAAETLVQVVPTNGFAYAVQAATAAVEEDWPAMNAALVVSASVTPHEQWIAEARSRLAEEHYARLDPAARAAHDDDLELLVRTRQGVASIARRYVARADFRERIVSVVERMEAADQSRFLYNIRAAYGLQPVWQANPQ